MKSNQLYKYLFFAAAAYIAFFLLFPAKPQPATEGVAPAGSGSGMVLEAVSDSFHPGEAVKLKVGNPEGSAGALAIEGLCQTGTVAVKRDSVAVDLSPLLNRLERCPTTSATVEPGEETTLSLDYLHTPLSAVGRYEVTLVARSDATGELLSGTTAFAVEQRGVVGRTWDVLFYQPLYNLLILLVSILPGNDLGWAVVLLTIVIRLILLIPNQKALESQKKLQLIQPKLNEIQEKYKGDTKRIGEETMKLWKENGVNPMGSCLPMLLQMPFLIALYYAVSHGLEQSSTWYLYQPLQGFPINQITTQFLGVLDLSRPNLYVLPPLLVFLQWYQMHLTMARTPATGKAAAADPNRAMNQTMKYAMPLLIGVMSVSFPAGVALYWGVSTAFGIAQQWWVNKMTVAK